MGGETSLFTHRLCKVSKGQPGSLRVVVCGRDTGSLGKGEDSGDSLLPWEPGDRGGGGLLTTLVLEAGKGFPGWTGLFCRWL